MQLCIKFSGRTSFLQIDQAQCIESLKESLGIRYNLDVSRIVLLHNTKCLVDQETIIGSGIRNLETITMHRRLLGGKGSMTENDKAIAMKERNAFKICRGCYARMPLTAEKCRKERCRSKDLRPKKGIRATKK